MNRLVAVAMVVTVVALVGELARDALPAWRAILSLALTLAAIVVAGARTVRHAVRLGQQADDAGIQSQLARMILRDHVLCISAIGAVLLLQLWPA